jgi:hypothetical protein
MKTRKQQNNYKENLAIIGMEKKKGQVTIFIIIAVVIVVGIIVFFLLSPNFGISLRGEIVPNEFLKEKVESVVKSEVEVLSKQGGYSEPEGAILYEGNRVKYLCYTAQYYLPCKVQQPMIKQHFENELNEKVRGEVELEVNNLIAEYERRGFEVSEPDVVESEVKLVPGKIRIDVEAPMTVRKDDVTQNFNEFNLEIKSEMYDLLMLATSITDYESTYGDASTDLYSLYYPNLDIQKNKLGDGSTIYKLRDVTTNDEFTFASRGLAWPGGYGFEAP